MNKKELAKQIIYRLERYYGKKRTVTLDYTTPWELLTATILSAQCTDKRVNTVTPFLFSKYPDASSMAKANISNVEKIIHSLGFYRAKAENIVYMSKDIQDKFKGEVPRTLKELTSLSGVGRKTANVIRGNIFNDPSIVVDTHVKRVSKRMGLTTNTDPTKVEIDLMKILPKENWIQWNVWIITLGRSFCSARKIECEKCPIEDICPKRM